MEVSGAIPGSVPSTGGGQGNPALAIREALADLLARTEAATDRLRDDDVGLLFCALYGKAFESADISCGDDGSDELNVWAPGGWHVWGDYRHSAPDVSVDAALALIRQMLRGWHVQVENHPPNPVNPRGLSDATLWETDLDKPYHMAEAATAALALCAALMMAIGFGDERYEQWAAKMNRERFG